MSKVYLFFYNQKNAIDEIISLYVYLQNWFIFAFVDDGHIYEEEGVDMTDTSFVCIITFTYLVIEIYNFVMIFTNNLLQMPLIN